MIVLGVVLVVVVALVVWWLVRGRSQTSDGMTTFQRQIDALSPEARRPVVDQVQRAKKDDDDEEAESSEQDDS